jgi:transposase
MNRKPYPSDVTDEEWAFVAPYLTLIREEAPQRDYSLREAFNGLRWIIRTGAQWRMMPNDLPPWATVYQQTQRWIKAGVFEAMVHDLRALLRLAAGRGEQPTAAIFDSRTLQSTPESGARAGYDGAKRRKGSKVHAAVDTLGQLLALHVTSANAQDRDQVAQLAQDVQAVTEQHVEVVFVDQGYTGDTPEQAAAEHDLRLVVVKLPEAKKGFVLLPRRWVVERSFGWASRFRRLARDYERLPETLKGLHFLAFATLMLAKFVHAVAFVTKSGQPVGCPPGPRASHMGGYLALLHPPDPKDDLSTGRLCAHLVALLVAHQRRADRALVRDLAFLRVGYRRPDDGIGFFFAAAIFHNDDRRANANYPCRRIALSNHCSAQNALDVANAPLDEALLFLGVVIICVLFQITHRDGIRDLARQLWPAHGLEHLQLALKLVFAFAGQVLYLSHTLPLMNCLPEFPRQITIRCTHPTAAAAAEQRSQCQYGLRPV